MIKLQTRRLIKDATMDKQLAEGSQEASFSWPAVGQVRPNAQHPVVFLQFLIDLQPIPGWCHIFFHLIIYPLNRIFFLLMQVQGWLSASHRRGIDLLLLFLRVSSIVFLFKGFFLGEFLFSWFEGVRTPCDVILIWYDFINSICSFDDAKHFHLPRCMKSAI